MQVLFATLLLGTLALCSTNGHPAQQALSNQNLLSNLGSLVEQHLISILQQACDAGCCGVTNSSITSSLPCCSSCEHAINLMQHGIPFSIDNSKAALNSIGFCHCSDGTLSATCCAQVIGSEASSRISAAISSVHGTAGTAPSIVAPTFASQGASTSSSQVPASSTASSATIHHPSPARTTPHACNCNGVITVAAVCPSGCTSVDLDFGLPNDSITAKDAVLSTEPSSDHHSQFIPDGTQPHACNCNGVITVAAVCPSGCTSVDLDFGLPNDSTTAKDAVPSTEPLSDHHSQFIPDGTQPRACNCNGVIIVEAVCPSGCTGVNLYVGSPEKRASAGQVAKEEL